jgi:hypothetical protein
MLWPIPNVSGNQNRSGRAEESRVHDGVFDSASRHPAFPRIIAGEKLAQCYFLWWSTLDFMGSAESEAMDNSNAHNDAVSDFTILLGRPLSSRTIAGDTAS